MPHRNSCTRNDYERKTNYDDDDDDDDLIDDEIKTLLVNRKKSSWYDEYWIGWRIREFAVFFPKISSYIKVGDNAEKGQRKKKISNQILKNQVFVITKVT